MHYRVGTTKRLKRYAILSHSYSSPGSRHQQETSSSPGSRYKCSNVHRTPTGASPRPSDVQQTSGQETETSGLSPDSRIFHARHSSRHSHEAPRPDGEAEEKQLGGTPRMLSQHEVAGQVRGLSLCTVISA